MALNAAALIPWREIIKIAPVVVGAARDLWNQRNTAAAPAAMDAHAETEDQIAAIVKRLQVLETTETRQADLVRQIAEQVQGLSVGLHEVSKRATIAFWLAGAATALSAIVLLTLLFRA